MLSVIDGTCYYFMFGVDPIVSAIIEFIFNMQS